MRLPQPLLRNKREVHKGTFGHVLIIGGSRKMLGAGCLTALAALRSGAGLVTLAVPFELMVAAQIKVSPCVMVQDVKTLNKNILLTYSAIALGPGLGRGADSIKLTQRIITTTSVPLVIDADALFAVSKKLAVLTKTKAPKILTPHPGEMKRLSVKYIGETEKDRKKTAREFVKKYNCTLVLKGHRTIVADDKKIYTNTTGNAGMATAGSGDVLTGMIAAFLAQGLNAFDAAKWGAYLHGKAGDAAAQKLSKTSLIATDILDHIPRVLKIA